MREKRSRVACFRGKGDEYIIGLECGRKGDAYIIGLLAKRVCSKAEENDCQRSASRVRAGLDAARRDAGECAGSSTSLPNKCTHPLVSFFRFPYLWARGDLTGPPVPRSIRDCISRDRGQAHELKGCIEAMCHAGTP